MSGIITGVVILVIVLTILSTGMPLIGDAGDSMSNVSTICNTAFGCYWNNSGTAGAECQVDATNSTPACSYGQPVVLTMTSFFNSSGIIILAIMGVVILAVLGYIGIKKKGR